MSKICELIEQTHGIITSSSLCPSYRSRGHLSYQSGWAGVSCRSEPIVSDNKEIKKWTATDHDYQTRLNLSWKRVDDGSWYRGLIVQNGRGWLYPKSKSIQYQLLMAPDSEEGLTKSSGLWTTRDQRPKVDASRFWTDPSLSARCHRRRQDPPPWSALRKSFLVRGIVVVVPLPDQDRQSARAAQNEKTKTVDWRRRRPNRE